MLSRVPLYLLPSPPLSFPFGPLWSGPCRLSADPSRTNKSPLEFANNDPPIRLDAAWRRFVPPAARRPVATVSLTNYFDCCNQTPFYRLFPQYQGIY